jgi:hypothetical protein
MEKLVGRHFRKEPGHLACRAGPFTYALLLTVFAFSPAAAQTMGNPARVVRIHSAEALSSNDVAITAPVSVESAVTTAATEPAKTAPTGEQRAKNRLMVSTRPYLPLTGALPLRFSAARKWPAPVPADETPGEAEAPVVATTTPTLASEPTEPTATAEPVRPPSPAQATPQPITAVVASAQPSTKTSPTLTADMVLGFLGDLPPPEARVSVRFEPALPQGASSSAGLGALSP